MVKPNRSVLRSKNMLRKAYIELSTEKDASKITVVDVVNRANLSRNTFYAHYPDVNAIRRKSKTSSSRSSTSIWIRRCSARSWITRCRCSSASSSLS